jgi:8-oxo-dGTP pyrophosphatase MutT (NUDIX family)
VTGPSPEDEHGRPRFHMTGEEVIHESVVFSVTKATFVDPRGSTFERDIVRHPGAVAVVAVTDDLAVVLVRQFRGPLDQWILEVPAGTCDVDGEAAMEAAHRELAEEAGYSAARLTLLTRCAVTPGFCDERSSVYLATGLQAVPFDRQGIEEIFMEVVEVPLDDFDDLVDAGVIIDATTILGVGLARRRLARSVIDSP